MGMFAVKNDKGEFAHIDMDELTWETGFATLWFGVNEPYAKRTAYDYGGHVVELVEKPEPVVVSKTEAEMLEQAKQNTNPFYILWWNNTTVTNDHNQQERLMRAYVNGWTVEKPKWWNVKVPHTDGYWFYLRENHKPAPVSDHAYARDFTAAEIEHYGLQDCEKVEVKQDEN